MSQRPLTLLPSGFEQTGHVPFFPQPSTLCSSPQTTLEQSTGSSPHTNGRRPSSDASAYHSSAEGNLPPAHVQNRSASYQLTQFMGWLCLSSRPQLQYRPSNFAFTSISLSAGSDLGGSPQIAPAPPRAGAFARMSVCRSASARVSIRRVRNCLQRGVRTALFPTEKSDRTRR